MKVAIIGAGEDALLSIREAKKMHIETLALDDDVNAPGFKEADAYRVIDFSNTEELIELIRNEKVAFLMPFVQGEKTIAVGKINDTLRLPGYSESAAALCYDKRSFHKKLRAKGLRLCHSFSLNKDSLFPPFDITYPAIIRPRYENDGDGEIYYMSCPGDLVEFQMEKFGIVEEPVETPMKNYGIKPIEESTLEGWDATVLAKKEANRQVKLQILQLNKELQELNKQKEETPLKGLEWLLQKKNELAQKNKKQEEIDTNREYVLEELFEGDQYCVDAAMEGCNFEIVLLRKTLMSTPPAMQAVGYLTMLPEYDRALYDRVKMQLDKVIEIIGLRDCAFQADVRVRGKEVFVMHVMPRFPEPRIHDEYLLKATGIHIGREFLNYMSGKRHNFQPIQVKNTMLHYFDMENCFVHAVPTEKDLQIPANLTLKKWCCHIKTLDYLEPITDAESLSDRGYYILEGEKEKQLLEMVTNINKLFQIS